VPEMQQAVANAYRGFLHEPEVTVTLKDFDKPYFLASGEVARPGKYELRGDLTVNEAVAIAGGFTQQAGAFAGGGVSADFRVRGGVARDRRKEDAGCSRSARGSAPASRRFVYVPQSRISENPQVCSDQRAELVYESIAVLDLVLEERSGSVHFASAKSGRFPKVLPELTDCSTRHVQRTDRELAHECFPHTARTCGYAVPAATACGRRVWRGVGGDDAGGGVFGTL